MAAPDEVSKLQRHLTLLREEYVKLQTKLADLERKYSIAVASSHGDDVPESFASQLIDTISDLFDKDLYSDLTVKLSDSTVHAHKCVLAARSESWGVSSLQEIQTLDLTDISSGVGEALLRWVYMDRVEMRSKDDPFLLELMRCAARFKLTPLLDSCEKCLLSSVTVRNCLRFYQTAEEIGASVLRNHCSELISAHWQDFTSDDFARMPAGLLYSMFKSKTEYPLHTAIRLCREDVVFLYLVENDSALPKKLNEVDEQGDLPLDLALLKKQESIAQTLVNHRVDVDARDTGGFALLHKALRRGDESSATFLLANGCRVNVACQESNDTALHQVAHCSTNNNTQAAMLRVARLLLDKDADVNLQNKKKNTALHVAISTENLAVIDLLLAHHNINLELQNCDGQTPLWFALQPPATTTAANTSNAVAAVYAPDSIAVRLIEKGSSVDAVNNLTGDTLMQLAAREGMEQAALFLAEHGANVKHSNKKGEMALHTACERGLAGLSAFLLEKGANPNAQTKELPMAAPAAESELTVPVSRQTPLHMAIVGRFLDVVKVFVEFKNKCLMSTTTDTSYQIADFNVKDSQHQTALSLALWMSFHEVAAKLIKGGASIDVVDSDGMSLLHQAIMKQDSVSALFLLEHNANINLKTRENETALQLAIRRHLPLVVDTLCSRGADLTVTDEHGNCALWAALETGQEDVASVLVQHGCDATFWSNSGPGGCAQTLLHRAIDENNEAVACFLIRSGCDVNSCRRAGPGGAGEEEAQDKQSPLHMCCFWGQESAVRCLLEHNAIINSQDADGNTPIHIAIVNQHAEIINLLLSYTGLDLNLRNKQGQSPFSIAMTTKNNKAAQAILQQEPKAAEQVDNKGRNFLHIAIQKRDIESVLFLIGIHANVNSRLQDASQYTPLHLAVISGSDMIVRNLLLAGADVRARTHQKQTALHLAGMHDQKTICSILLENKVDYNAQDDNLNNALHATVRKGHINTVRALLTESNIAAEKVNLKGQTPIHLLGQYGRENAAAIFDLFMESMPDYPVNAEDVDGNTVLLLAYMNGNGNLCRAIVKSGAILGIPNKNGVSIFNYQVATKQLLFRLLDMLSKEPAWSDGDNCQECDAKFGIKTRKHHCRHCGRLLCSKCSEKSMPIIKFDLGKPVRVCDVCFDVLTLGSPS